MEIKPSEVEDIKEIGELDGEPVRLVKTFGGFFIAVGKKKGKEEALAAGSHEAIVRYNVEKQHRNFRPSMTKSESMILPEVIGMSELLPKDLRSKGFDMYSLKKHDGDKDFVITKLGSEVAKFQTISADSDLIVLQTDKHFDGMAEEQVKKASAALTVAIMQEAKSSGKSNIVHKSTKVPVK